jgi:hypothetical protein
MSRLKGSLYANGYREQPELSCCRNCRHSRPANMTWSKVRCDQTRNEDEVSDTCICDRYEGKSGGVGGAGDTVGATGTREVTP